MRENRLFGRRSGAGNLSARLYRGHGSRAESLEILETSPIAPILSWEDDACQRDYRDFRGGEGDTFRLFSGREGGSRQARPASGRISFAAASGLQGRFGVPRELPPSTQSRRAGAIARGLVSVFPDVHSGDSPACRRVEYTR